MAHLDEPRHRVRLPRDTRRRSTRPIGRTSTGRRMPCSRLGCRRRSTRVGSRREADHRRRHPAPDPHPVPDHHLRADRGRRTRRAWRASSPTRSRASSAGRTCGSAPPSARRTVTGGRTWTGRRHNFTPYLHQAKAFARLSTMDKPAEPTLITTGTGSGKTESFLIPVLDHCRRQKQQGRAGIKAILLYPMNALATDQTQRISELLADPALARSPPASTSVTWRPSTYRRGCMTKRSEMRRTPPDILITNYKMLDLLLQRADDLPLWEGAEPAYVVLDEFHTYDGAQGTDVAMLLRRLAAALGARRAGASARADLPGRHLGHPRRGRRPGRPRPRSARSPSRSSGSASTPARWSARTATSPGSSSPDQDFSLPLPSPEQLAAVDDRDPDRMIAEVAELLLGERCADNPTRLGELLRRHPLTKAVLDSLGPKPRTLEEVIDVLPRKNATGWGSAMKTRPEITAKALARFVGAALRGAEPGGAGPSAAQHRDPPVGTRRLPAAARHLPPGRLRLVRRGAPRAGPVRVRGRRGGGRQPLPAAARHLLPALRPFRLDGAVAGEGPAGAGDRPGQDLPGQRRPGQAAGPRPDRRDRGRGAAAAGRPAGAGARPAGAPLRPAAGPHARRRGRRRAR